MNKGALTPRCRVFDLTSPLKRLKGEMMMRKIALLIAALAAAGMLMMTAGCKNGLSDGGPELIPTGIIMKTAITGSVSIYLDGKDYKINWGDDSPIEEVTGLYDDDFYHTYSDDTERTITITGDIYVLDCNNMELKSLDLRAATELQWLECYRNSLTKLDLSKNTALTELRCQDNDMDAAALNALFTSLPFRPPADKGRIFIAGNPGEGFYDATIAEDKNWEFFWW